MSSSASLSSTLASWGPSRLVALIESIAANNSAFDAAIRSAIADSSAAPAADAVPAYTSPFVPSWPENFLRAISHRTAGSAVGSPSALLFTPKALGPVTLKNRFIVSPMCQYSSQPFGPEKGYFNDWHVVQLGRYAIGGAALVFTEATAVEPRGRISPWDTGIWSDGHIAGLKKIADFVHSQGALFGVQLAHAGRKASTNPPWVATVEGNTSTDEKHYGWTTDVVGPSAIPWDKNWIVPKELSKKEIKETVQLFVDGAIRAHKAGSDAIEIHAAHGYLLSSFLSPLSNQRSDEYGGSFENRIRLLIEVLDAVRAHWPAEKLISLRISCSEWVEGGWDTADSVRLAAIVAEHGVHLFDASTGGNSAHQKIAVAPGFQVPYAEAVKKAVGEKTALQVGTVGLLTESKQVEDILQQGRADFIVVARELLRNPSFPLQAAHQLGVDIQWAPQTERAKVPIKK